MKYRIIGLATLLVILVCTFSGFYYLVNHYRIKQAYVEGAVHYTSDEIKDIVMQGPLGDNSLYLSLRWKDRKIEDVPFVQTMDVQIISADTIRIMVYEKAVAGYVEYLGSYMYFDKDGIIVESSDRKTMGIPQVTGLTFDHLVMHEALEVKEPGVFEDILDITQLLKKYNISADVISFDKSLRKTLRFGDAKVSLGSNDNIGEKIMKLSAILPELEGRKGTLRMDNYKEGVTNITFELD